MKSNSVAGITTDKIGGNIVLSSDRSNVIVPFYKSESYVLDNINFIKFIKNVEMQVRTSKEYSAYIRYLKEELNPPLNHCMVYSNITDEDAPIEMHHGVIFTLFDYVEIIMNWCIYNKMLFSSSKVFSIIMDEHRLNNIQVVMLSEDVHIAIHNRKSGVAPKFIDYNMCHGDIVTFLNKYYTGLSYNHIGKLKSYFDSYEINMNKKDKFFDEFITKWSDEIMG